MRRTRQADRPAAEREAGDVLIIEADPELQVGLAHLLRRMGHRVVAASSASGALALTTHFPVDLILVSQELPRTTGVDVTYALTSQRPSLPVVVVTSEGGPGLRTAARRAGAQDCVPRTEVEAAVDRWLGDEEARSRTGPAAFAEGYEVAAQSAE